MKALLVFLQFFLGRNLITRTWFTCRLYTLIVLHLNCCKVPPTWLKKFYKMYLHVYYCTRCFYIISFALVQSNNTQKPLTYTDNILVLIIFKSYMYYYFYNILSFKTICLFKKLLEFSIFCCILETFFTVNRTEHGIITIV